MSNRELRVQKAVAKLGFSSRRKAADLIEQGRVKVNGQEVKKLYIRVDLEKDKITVDGKEGEVEEKKYIMLNKPKGVVSTVKDEHADETVLDFVKNEKVRLYPVGRLDKLSTGLLILTNDGELTYRLTHPKFEIKKVYEVIVEGKVIREKKEKLEKGVELEGEKTAPCKIKIESEDKNETELKINLIEGKKRQIRKMFQKMGHSVKKIHRIAMGPLKLKNLHKGEWRYIKENELNKLKKATGMED